MYAADLSEYTLLTLPYHTALPRGKGRKAGDVESKSSSLPSLNGEGCESGVTLGTESLCTEHKWLCFKLMITYCPRVNFMEA